MDVTLAVAADYASTSADGKLNILGVFTEVNAPQLPFQLPQMYLVLSYEVSAAESAAEKQIEITLRDSNDDAVMVLREVIKVPQQMALKDVVVLNQVVGLANLTFSKSGTYQFVISIDGEHKRAVILHVNEGPEGGQYGD